MRHRLFVHLVWTTQDRVRSIDRRAAEFLIVQLPLIAAKERATVLAIGIVSTHLHMLVRLHPATSLPRMVQRLKGTTSHGIRATGNAAGPMLRWSKGYTVHSVSESAIPRTFEYVVGQPGHHADEAIPNWHPEVAILNAE